MTDATESANELSDRVTTRDLSGATRGLFSLVGSLGLAAGGIAVFETANQAGTVALLAVGSIASLLAVVGKVPLRWVIGGNEFDMSERVAQETADEVAAQLPPAATAELAERLTSIGGGHESPMASAMANYVRFEQLAISRVMLVTSGRGWTYFEPARGADAGVDGFVATPDGRLVPIEYKFVREESAIRSVLRRVIERRGGIAPHHLIVVVSGQGPLTPAVADLVKANEYPRLHVVFLDAPDFESSFVAAVDEASAGTGDS